MKDEEELIYLAKQLRELKKKKIELKNKIKFNKKKNIVKKEKDDKINNGSNIGRRMSIKFFNQMNMIDEKRRENGFDNLSLPEKTELIIKHKNWSLIQDDIIHFDKSQDLQNGRVLNVQIIK
jgi:hypothetical protein